MDSSGNARSSAHQLNQFVSHGGQTAVNAGTLTNNGNLTINAGAANNLLKDLPCLNDAVYGYYKEDGEEEEEEEGDEEPICHEGTRTAILAEIDEWLNAENSESIFWISGWAGTGKSTIARTVAKDNIDKGRASASFFFARGKGDRARAKHLTTTITRQLAYSSSSLKPRIISVLERDPEIHHKRLELQWRQLIFGPISEQDGPITNSPISLVIDGLDECEDQKGLGILIDLLRGTHPRNLRLLVTSRPSVLDRFQATETLNCHYQHCVLHTMDGNVVNEDICHFLRDNFRRRRVGIAEKHLQQLVHLAGGLFVWADTAIKFITYDKSFGQKRLNEILLVLRAAIRPRLSRDELRIYCEAMRHLLGCIVALYSELPPRSLYNLIDNERFSEEDHMISLHEMLKSLRAILDVPDQKDEDSATIQLHHLSLRDFLSDADRCTDERFLVNQVGAHTTLFQNCIRVLRGFREREIPQDVARISIDQKQSYDNPVITPQIEYASLYWVRHLRDSGRAVYDDDDIHQFLKDHALHWLESLSWMEKIDEAVDAMDCLCSLAMDHQSHGLLNFVMGLKEITENRRVLISQSPLQIYSSALIFTPEDNPVRQTCGQEALRWLEYLPKSRKKWRDYLWDHQYYGCDTLSIAFAHSSIALVIRSALCTGVIEAYEPWSGKVLWILGNDGDGITAPTVSQDSEKLAFASHATVHIHEAATGREIQTLTGSEDLIKIAFTGNDQLLLTVSRNCRVAFWDLASGMCLNEVFMDFEKSEAIILSQDGMIMVSCPAESTWLTLHEDIRIWKVTDEDVRRYRNLDFDPCFGCSQASDPTSGKGSLYLYRLRVAISKDGSLLATAILDTIKIFYTVSGKLMTTLCSGDIGYVNALAFAPDSRTLALSANGVTVWDLVTGQCLKKLDTDYIYDTNQMLHVVGLAFSVRGDLLALLDQGDQLKLWNWKTSSNEGSDDYSTKPIRLARVMSDGRLVIAASDAHIDLWNAETGRHLVALGGHKDQASVLKLPYNNRALALTSKDGCMRHWNLALGDCFGVLNIGGSHYYSAVTLSCDGKLVAFPLDDEAVEIWETTGNRTVRIEAACSSWISRLAFSRDGSMLASGAKDINIWETQTGQNICSIGGQNGLVRDMIFSVDGNFLASCADSDNTVRIWNTSTGKCIRVLSHENSICAIAISRDSRILASIHGRSIIYIWDLEHNRLLDRMKRPGLALSEDHFWFSDDGRFLCSDFGCVRLDLRDMNDSEGKGEWSIGKSRCHSHSISVRDDWVMKGDKRIIWIPPEYRDRQPVIVRDRTIVLRPSGGVLTILRLRPDMHFG